MKTRILRSIRVALVGLGIGLVGCGGIRAEDCRLECDYIKQDCFQKCTDDMCRQSCETRASECSLKCGTVTTTNPPPNNTNTSTY